MLDGNKALSWVNAQYTAPDCIFKDTLEGPPEDGEIKTPFQFFKKMITNDTIQNLADQTNIYSLQRDGTLIATSNKEIEIIIGLYFRMGIVQMPRIKSYWETETRYYLIADAMSRNRFEKLVSTLHFRNKLEATEEEQTDKLWKLRPWLKTNRDTFLQIQAEEHNSVDEMMVNFKGKSTIKQYIRGKTQPMGF